MLKEFLQRRALRRKFPKVSFGNAVQVIGINGISFGEGSCVGARVWINDCVRDGQLRINIGRKVLLGRGSMISAQSQLEIGDFGLIGPNCCFSNADHQLEDLYSPFIEQGAVSTRPLIIEENCWFGYGALVPKGITIGRGSIVGAGSVVLKDIPPFCVAVGNPARIVKFYDFAQNSWRQMPHQDGMGTLGQSRTNHPPPGRADYLLHLNNNNRTRNISSILTGH
jgi:acetyltransferase-like isoleucine patch superfamily enzyme